MRRRYFILTSLSSLLGIGIFSMIQWFRNSGQDKALAKPKFLSLLCDRKTIRMLGNAYLKLKPEETRDDVLLNDILAEKPNKIFAKGQDTLMVESQIEKRIRQDFDTDNIVVVQGWVLSITEARQCAFFSILNS
jgi:hypothetical protein